MKVCEPCQIMTADAETECPKCHGQMILAAALANVPTISPSAENDIRETIVGCLAVKRPSETRLAKGKATFISPNAALGKLPIPEE